MEGPSDSSKFDSSSEAFAGPEHKVQLNLSEQNEQDAARIAELEDVFAQSREISFPVSEPNRDEADFETYFLDRITELSDSSGYFQPYKQFIEDRLTNTFEPEDIKKLADAYNEIVLSEIDKEIEDSEASYDRMFSQDEQQHSPKAIELQKEIQELTEKRAKLKFLADFLNNLFDSIQGNIKGYDPENDTYPTSSSS